jgi:hypothetical protein
MDVRVVLNGRTNLIPKIAEIYDWLESEVTRPAADSVILVKSQRKIVGRVFDLQVQKNRGLR